MAGEQKTTKKLPKKPFTGKEGNTFSADNQPLPEAKSEGWKKKRAQRLLTQAILAHMMNGNNLDDYVQSLHKNAKKGNAKAIETINKGIEDDILKVEHSGNIEVPITFILDERYNKDNSGIST